MKTDYKKVLKNLYAPKARTPGVVSVPAMNFLMISGNGLPQDESFRSAAQTLFPVAYVAKFILKAENPDNDFTVMPMEVKWKLDRSRHGSKRYYWTMMIMQPEYLDESIIVRAIDTLRRKKKSSPYEKRLRLRNYNGGLCGQILHIGPYGEAMERTFDILKNELSVKGYDWEPDSHDVYYNDTRRTPAEKLKTLTRVRIWKKGEAASKLDDPFMPWE